MAKLRTVAMLVALGWAVALAAMTLEEKALFDAALGCWTIARGSMLSMTRGRRRCWSLLPRDIFIPQSSSSSGVPISTTRMSKGGRPLWQQPIRVSWRWSSGSSRTERPPVCGRARGWMRQSWLNGGATVRWPIGCGAPGSEGCAPLNRFRGT